MLLNNKEFRILKARRQRLSVKHPLKTLSEATQRTQTKNRSKQHSFIFSRRMGFFLRLLGGFIFALLSITFLQLVSTTSKAASISVQTHNTIEGSAPALTLYGSSTPVTSAEQLLTFMINGKAITPSTPSSEIVIEGTQSIAAQVKTLSGSDISNQDIALNTLPASVIKALDADGDTAKPIKGTMMVKKITDNEGTVLTDAELQANPDICRTPYKLTLQINNAQAETVYGSPNQSVSLSTRPHTYIITINNASPQFCYAQPSLTPNPTYTTPEGVAIPPKSVWNPQKGFLVQSRTDATQNFPGTGFKGAYFDLLVAGIADIGKASDWKVHPQGEGINIALSKVNNTTLRVTFVDAILDPTGNYFKPTAFRIYHSGNPNITIDYQFRVHTWLKPDAFNMTQSAADFFCTKQLGNKQGNPAWSAISLKGALPYGLSDDYVTGNSQVDRHRYYRAIISAPWKRGFPFIHEWGQQVADGMPEPIKPSFLLAEDRPFGSGFKGRGNSEVVPLSFTGMGWYRFWNNGYHPEAYERLIRGCVSVYSE